MNKLRSLNANLAISDKATSQHVGIRHFRHKNSILNPKKTWQEALVKDHDKRRGIRNFWTWMSSQWYLKGFSAFVNCVKLNQLQKRNFEKAEIWIEQLIFEDHKVKSLIWKYWPISSDIYFIF